MESAPDPLEGCLRRERWFGKGARIVPFSSDTIVWIKNLNRIYCFFHIQPYISWVQLYSLSSWKWPHHFQGHQRLEFLQEFLLIPMSLLSEFLLLTPAAPQNLVFPWINPDIEPSPNLKFTPKPHFHKTHTHTHTHDWTIYPQLNIS